MDPSEVGFSVSCEDASDGDALSLRIVPRVRDAVDKDGVPLVVRHVLSEVCFREEDFCWCHILPLISRFCAASGIHFPL